VRKLNTGFAAALFGASLATTAIAQDKAIELRFAHWVPPTHPMHISAEKWAESINKASNGTITVKIFPAQQLGKAADHYNMARDGIAQISHVNPGYEPGRFPVIAGMEMPFIVANAVEGSAAIDAWYRKYAAKEMQDVKYCLLFVHDPGTFHSTKKRIVVPDDIKGMRIRPANGTIARYMVLLGGTNVQSSAPEIREVLERGVADAATAPWGSVLLFGIDKVTKHHMDAPIYVTEQVWVLNKASYDGMSAGQKKVMDEHCTTDWALRIGREWAAMESAGKDKLRAAGHDVYPITKEQLDAWRKSAEPLHAEWEAAAKKAGHDPKAVFNELKAEVAKRNVAY
jgi:TRAP-type C4-dicarboxylate transport system substrate-binding protein